MHISRPPPIRIFLWSPIGICQLRYRTYGLLVEGYFYCIELKPGWLGTSLAFSWRHCIVHPLFTFIVYLFFQNPSFPLSNLNMIVLSYEEKKYSAKISGACEKRLIGGIDSHSISTVLKLDSRYATGLFTPCLIHRSSAKWAECHVWHAHFDVDHVLRCPGSMDRDAEPQ